MEKRNNLDIVAEILRVSLEGAKKTWIVYKANLNFRIVDRYLKQLIEKGLIKKSSGIYITSERGLEFLDGYDHIMKLISGEGEGEGAPSRS